MKIILFIHKFLTFIEIVSMETKTDFVNLLIKNLNNVLIFPIYENCHKTQNTSKDQKVVTMLRFTLQIL